MASRNIRRYEGAALASFDALLRGAANRWQPKMWGVVVVVVCLLLLGVVVVFGFVPLSLSCTVRHSTAAVWAGERVLERGGVRAGSSAGGVKRLCLLLCRLRLHMRRRGRCEGSEGR